MRIPEETQKECAGIFLEPGWPNLEEITGLKDFPTLGTRRRHAAPQLSPQQPPSLPTREMAKKAKKGEEEAPKKGKKSAAKK